MIIIIIILLLSVIYSNENCHQPENYIFLDNLTNISFYSDGVTYCRKININQLNCIGGDAKEKNNEIYKINCECNNENEFKCKCKIESIYNNYILKDYNVLCDIYKFGKGNPVIFTIPDTCMIEYKLDYKRIKFDHLYNEKEEKKEYLYTYCIDNEDNEPTDTDRTIKDINIISREIRNKLLKLKPFVYKLIDNMFDMYDIIIDSYVFLTIKILTFLNNK